MTTRPNDLAWWIVDAMRQHHIYCCSLNLERNEDSAFAQRDGTYTLVVATDFHGARITITQIEDPSDAYASEGNLDYALRDRPYAR